MPFFYTIALRIRASDGIFTYQSPQKLNVGIRIKVPFRKRSLLGLVLEEVNEPSFPTKEISSCIDKESLLGPYTKELARWLAETSFISFGEALWTLLPGKAIGTKQIQQDYLDDDVENISSQRIQLNADQEKSLQSILEGTHQQFFLWGPTGSGKSEVLIQATERILEKEGSVLFLVPEITLAFNLWNELYRRLDPKHPKALLHSALTDAQRLGQWRLIQKKPYSLVIGARSALWAPLKNLQLIIIDEEHEASYKSEQNPRVLARHVAFFLKKTTGSRLVLSSATPCLESYRAFKQEKLRLLRLYSKAAGGQIKSVHVVSLKEKKLQIPLLSNELLEAIKASAQAKRQSLLFLNRRGFMNVLYCHECNWQKLCPACGVPLTYHKRKEHLLCHYCGQHFDPPKEALCPSCKSMSLSYKGIGTEFIEEQLRHLFPELRIQRLDADTAEDARSIYSILHDFNLKKIDLLLGTQMIAKGLNFKHLRLVGILLAEQGLHFPDFRAKERNYALLRQVIGRVGRFAEDGEILIQTYDPQNDALLCALDSDEEAFYQKELELRQNVAFPPFGFLFRYVLRGRHLENLEKTTQNLVNLLKKANRGIEILGPSECFIRQIAGKYRYQILLRSNSQKKLYQISQELLSTWKPPSSITWEIDTSPLSML